MIEYHTDYEDQVPKTRTLRRFGPGFELFMSKNSSVEMRQHAENSWREGSEPINVA